MAGYTGLFVMTICVIVSVIECSHAGLCRKLIQDGCRCYKEEIESGIHSRNMTLRYSPVPCVKPCSLYSICPGAVEEHGPIPTRKISNACSGVTIISRQQWGAKNATGPIGVIRNPVGQFYIHHTDTQPCDSLQSCAKLLQSIQRYHFSLGWSDIGYSFLVGEDGNIYEGRGWNKVGAHTEGYNSVSYAASFMGNYMSKLPINKALTAAQQLIACGIQLGKIDPLYSLYGHRDADGDTDCPGNALYKHIHGWKYYNRTPNPSAGCVAKGRRCKQSPNTCKPGSLVVGPSLCQGGNKYCCFKP